MTRTTDNLFATESGESEVVNGSYMKEYIKKRGTDKKKNGRRKTSMSKQRPCSKSPIGNLRKKNLQSELSMGDNISTICGTEIGLGFDPSSILSGKSKKSQQVDDII